MNAIRAQIEKLGRSPNPLLRAGYLGLKGLGALRRFVVSRRIRWQVITRIQHKDRQFQGDTASREDRYPELFEECRKRLAEYPCPRILSFGCATGEEVFTLAKYLPQAEITGVDINAWCLKRCDRKNTSRKLRFVHRLSEEFAALGGYDAIFCMAVFQRTEHRTARADPAHTGFTFERFEAEVGLLGNKLKPGGLLFFDECDFSFEQTAVASEYEALDFEGSRKLQQRPLFGRDNRLIAQEHISARGFMKRAD